MLTRGLALKPLALGAFVSDSGGDAGCQQGD